MTIRKNKNTKPRIRLTQEDVIDIIDMRKNGNTIQDICDKYRMKRAQISRILNGKSNSKWTKNLLFDLPKKKVNRVNEKTLFTIIKMRKSGSTIKQIATKFNLSVGFISNIFEGETYCPRGILSKKDLLDIVEMRKSGVSLKEVANKFNLTEQYIGSVLNGKKLSKWTKKFLPEVKDDRIKLSDAEVLNIVELLKNQVSQEKISVLYDVSQAVISKIYKGEIRKNINTKQTFSYKCKHCGELFERKYNVQEFCSQHCRLWFNIDKKPYQFLKSPCYEWKLDKDKDKYGKISWKNENGKIANFRVIRLVLEEKLGRKMKPGMLACHTCDNASCCNPKHLYEGTHKTNKADCVRRDRNGNSKFTTKTATQVLKELDSGSSIKELAKKFNVSRVTIYDIQSGKSWKHIPR